jgi:hypothetical protein
MFDFPVMPDVATKGSWIFCAMIYVITIMLFYGSETQPKSLYNEQKSGRFVFLLLFYLFIICPFYTGDFAHYQSLVYTYNGQENFHLENIYRYIIVATHNNYLLFRLIVWGIGFFAVFTSFKQYKLNPYIALLYFFGVSITAFAYTRAGVAMAVYYLGVSIMFDKDSPLGLKSLIGLAIVIFSVCFHKSMLVLVFLTAFAFVPIDKRTIIPILITLFILSYSIESMIDVATSAISDRSEEMAYSIETYSKGKRREFGANLSIIGLIPLYWGKLTVHLPYLFSVAYLLRLTTLKTIYIPNNIKCLFRISFALYAFSIFMLIQYGPTSAFYYRYEGMLYFPICILLNYLYQYEIIPHRKYIRLFWFCSGLMSFNFLYVILMT